MGRRAESPSTVLPGCDQLCGGLPGGAGKACAALAAGHRRRDGAVPASAGIEYLLPLGNTVTLRTRRTVVCAFVEPTTGWTGGLPEGSSTPNR